MNPPKTRGRKINGWVLLDKPLGLTSVQALARVRKLLDADKAGHAGTLDPLASGVLPIALGEATKTIPFVQDATKVYRFRIIFGVEMTSDDLEGQPTHISAIRPSADQLIGAMADFVGEIAQIPPIYSAIHIDGRRAYDLARAGVQVDMAPRQVRIDRLELLAMGDQGAWADLRVVCGKGTYVRSLARDLARAVGTCGHVGVLVRERVGPFDLARAIGLERLAELDYTARVDQALHPVQTALYDIPALAITGLEETRLRQGLPITPGGRFASSAFVIVKAMGPDGLVALVDCTEAIGRPVRVFNLSNP